MFEFVQTHPVSTRQPVLATSVAHEIKAVGGCIWLLQKADFGLQIRAEIGRKQLRIVLQPLSGEGPPVPSEPNSSVFIVANIDDLRVFLTTLPNANG
ncbi:hypothetical protein [Spirosoma areae]